MTSAKPRRLSERWGVRRRRRWRHPGADAALADVMAISIEERAARNHETLRGSDVASSEGRRGERQRPSAQDAALRLSADEASREIFRRFAEREPEPKTRARTTASPFTLLVAVVLSAQATDAGVNKATPALFAKADTPEKMASSARRGDAS